jgi:hypothetical protein
VEKSVPASELPIIISPRKTNIMSGKQSFLKTLEATHKGRRGSFEPLKH